MSMSCLGNLIWMIFGGLLGAISWFLAGCLWCVTIIGIPIGLQCFKFASYHWLLLEKKLSIVVQEFLCY